MTRFAQKLSQLHHRGRGCPGDGPAPQLHVGVEGLATVLLGGTTWRSLAVAGLAKADDPTALVVADQLFAGWQAPQAGFFF